MALIIDNVVDTIEVEYKDGFKVEIAPGNSREFRNKFAKLKKKINSAGNRHRKKSDDLSGLTAEQQDQLLAEAYAGTVLVGWKGLSIGGKNIAYSDENAQDLLFNNDTFRNFVAEEAVDFDEFLREEKEATKKKSATPTAGD